MANEIQLLDPWKPLEIEVEQGMQQIANININTKYIDLGCGDGRNLELALSLGAKPANVFGVELDTALYNTCVGKGLNVFHDDLFNLNYSTYDLVSFWFTITPELVLAKLYNEMKKGKKVVALYGSRHQWRDGLYVPSESCYDVNTDVGVLPFSTWKPTAQGEVLGNRFYLYIR